jgi:hypothetical protein
MLPVGGEQRAIHRARGAREVVLVHQRVVTEVGIGSDHESHKSVAELEALVCGEAIEEIAYAES